MEQCRVLPTDVDRAQSLVDALIASNAETSLGKMQTVIDDFLGQHHLSYQTSGGVVRALINAERLNITGYDAIAPEVRSNLSMCLCGMRFDQDASAVEETPSGVQ
ncbi:MAG: hypothetical protein PHI23_04005 [Candidatus Peribacteraceae bacterium]|nr:hypothetical protein [Candidatus Peribacteraceae bacterium]